MGYQPRQQQIKKLSKFQIRLQNKFQIKFQNQSQPRLSRPCSSPEPIERTGGGFDPLGDLDNADQKIAINFTELGAGIESLRLPDDFETVAGKVHVTLQAKINLPGSTTSAVPFAAISVRVNDSIVDITGWAYPIWSQTSPGVFEAFIDDLEGNPHPSYPAPIHAQIKRTP